MRPWWISLLRAAILLTAVAVMLRGDVLYGLFCLVALGLALVPAALARSHHARAPVELELALLLLMVTDMTLGNLLGLYLRLPWFDKVLHLGTSILIGLIAFLAVYVLHVTGRIRFRRWLDGAAILLLTLGIGALWEIAEYAVDGLLGRSAQSAPGMSAIDDTMIDLIVDAIGGAVAAVLGPLYMKHSARSRERVREITALISRRRAPGSAEAVVPG